MNPDERDLEQRLERLRKARADVVKWVRSTTDMTELGDRMLQAAAEESPAKDKLDPDSLGFSAPAPHASSLAYADGWSSQEDSRLLVIPRSARGPVPCRATPSPSVLDIEPGRRPRRRPVVAIVGGGIASHPWFAETDWFAEVTPEHLDFVPVNGDVTAVETAGLVTTAVGEMLKLAPTAYVMVERVLNENGIGGELGVLRGLRRLLKRLEAAGTALDVLVFALGHRSPRGPSPVLKHALERFGPDTAIVAPAGNKGSDEPYWPAAADGVIGVAALSSDGLQRAEYSDFGPWVDACAVGTDVQGPYLSKVTAHGREFDGYAQWSATTFAAAHVAGAILAKAAADEISGAEAAHQLLTADSRVTMPQMGIVIA